MSDQNNSTRDSYPEDFEDNELAKSLIERSIPMKWSLILVYLVLLVGSLFAL